MNPYSLPIILAFTINISLALLVISNNYKNSQNILLFFYILSVSFWNLGDFLMINSKSPFLAEISAKMGLGGFFFSSVFFLHFSSIFPRKITEFFDKNHKLFLYYLLPFSYLFFVFTTRDIQVEKIKELGDMYYYRHALIDQPFSFYMGFLFLTGFVIIFSLFGIRNLLYSLKSNPTAREKNQIKYIIAGITLMVIFGLGIDLINYFFQLGFPFLYLFSTYSILISIFFAIAILRFHLLDIRFIIRGGVSYFILSGIVLASYLLLIKNLGEFLEKQTQKKSIIIESLLIVLLVIISRPLIKGMERGIDKIFYRGRYSLKRKVERFNEYLINTINLNDIIQKTVSFLQNQLKVQNVYIYLLNKDRTQFELIKGSNNFLSTAVSSEDPMIDFIKKSGYPLEITELQSIKENSPVMAYFLKSEISLLLPLLSKQRLEAFILMGNKISSTSWNQDELDLLSAFSDYLSAALSRALMANQLKEAEKEIAQSKKMASLGEYSAGIAHQIRNPLNVIAASAETLEKNDLDNLTKKHLIHYIQEESHKLDQLVNNFLNFAKPKNPCFTLEKIEQIIQSAINHIVKTSSKQIKFKTEIDCSFQPFLTDRQQLEQVLINILYNGVEASPPDKEINITAYPNKNGELIIKIKDRGKGIPLHLQEKVFDPFFSTKAKGTGMGLPIASKIIQSMGGSITLHSKEKKGTIFTVVLPLNKNGT